MTPLTPAEVHLTNSMRIAEIMCTIQRSKNNYDYRNNIFDEMEAYQPFILAMALQHKFDLHRRVWLSLLQLYIMIWEYYKDAPKVRSVRITEAEYENVKARNISWMQHAEKMFAEEKGQDVVADLTDDSSKALHAAIISEFKENEVFQQINLQARAVLLVGMRCVIQCFENISHTSNNDI